MKNFIIGAIITGVFLTFGIALTNTPEQYGASSGPDHLNREYFYGGLVQGGGIVIKTAGTSTTWTAKDVCDYSVIKWTPTVPSSSTTLPTSASLISTCLAKDGDFKDIVYWNGGLAATTTFFTKGTGMTIYIPEADGADKLVEGLNLVRIRFLRASSTAVFTIFDEELVQ